MLGHMDATQIQNMIEYYITSTQSELLGNAINDGSAPDTPAAVEALCSEHDGVDAVLNVICQMPMAVSTAVDSA
ncbi:hypothetical protein JG688_00018706 [Phytophthora aleatoria]|uniref:Uncharacterized protein n=1 Tax=Phytophthora aleatoria TaxID=2496075 RepID=A0A8J5I897_9STRA|nr:hypothetical protein JG688_00018706 [Phytophthora aleatoria]